VITDGTLDLNPARSPCADKVCFVVGATASVFAEPRGRRFFSPEDEPSSRHRERHVRGTPITTMS
jgi:hypothetical protein